MEKFKEKILEILYPNILIYLLTFIIGFGSVICIFIFNMSTHFLAYIAYVLSAYALTITVARCIKLVKWINKKLHANKYTSTLIKDRNLRSKISLFSGTIFNFIYGVFKIVTSFIYDSIWFGAIGGYYLILCLMKYILARYIFLKNDESKSVKQYRNTGIFMFLLNSAMVVMIVLMIREGESPLYPGFIIYAQAFYTFYTLTIALINVIKYRKDHTPLIAAAKSINLVTAIMALFILQVAMINEFGGSKEFEIIINTITGTLTSIITIGIAVFMIFNSKIMEKRK